MQSDELQKSTCTKKACLNKQQGLKIKQDFFIFVKSCKNSHILQAHCDVKVSGTFLLLWSDSMQTDRGTPRPVQVQPVWLPWALHCGGGPTPLPSAGCGDPATIGSEAEGSRLFRAKQKLKPAPKFLLYVSKMSS